MMYVVVYLVRNQIDMTLDRAKSIKNTASVNKDMSEKALLSSYQQEIKKLKRMLQERY